MKRLSLLRRVAVVRDRRGGVPAVVVAELVHGAPVVEHQVGTTVDVEPADVTGDRAHRITTARPGRVVAHQRTERLVNTGLQGPRLSKQRIDGPRGLLQA